MSILCLANDIRGRKNVNIVLEIVNIRIDRGGGICYNNLV